jgi:N-methylhydantoinase A
LKATAAKTAGLPAEQVQMLNDQGWMCVFTGERERKILLGLFTVVDTPVVVVDREGIVRLQVPDARVDYVAASELDGVLQKVIDQYTTYGDAGMVIPDVFLVKPGQIADLTGLVEANQMLSVARVETQTLAPSDKVALVSSRKG